MSTTELGPSAGDLPEDRDRERDAEEALLASLPYRLRDVVARSPRTRDSLPSRGGCADDPQLSDATQRVWDAEHAVAQAQAAQYRALAALHELDGEYEEVTELDEVDTLRAALGLRVSRSAASWYLRDAYQAVHHLPRALARLESGELPSAWFQRMLRSARPLSDASRQDLDRVISTWSADISPERFFTLLRALVEHLRAREDRPSASEAFERRVELLPSTTPGTGILQIVGPIPEILARWKSLDESARAVQAGQRAAVRDGTPIPHDPDGKVLETGRTTSLSELRYRLLEAAALDTDGIDVPASRFRLNVTVPVLTLAGASDEPGMLDGVTPLPASMARSLAGSCDVWYRVLTGAQTGAFLPLPAERITPTPAMLEHLRLRNGQCAVPGCTRPTSWASECDHIEEFLRGTPGAGGPTSIENLHLLCWQHHLDKTNGLLDPVRLEASTLEPGRTRWQIGQQGDEVTVIDDIDLSSLHMVEVLTATWSAFLRGDRAASRYTPPDQLEPLDPRGSPETEDPPIGDPPLERVRILETRDLGREPDRPIIRPRPRPRPQARPRIDDASTGDDPARPNAPVRRSPRRDTPDHTKKDPHSTDSPSAEGLTPPPGGWGTYGPPPF